MTRNASKLFEERNTGSSHHIFIEIKSVQFLHKDDWVDYVKWKSLMQKEDDGWDVRMWECEMTNMTKSNI